MPKNATKPIPAFNGRGLAAAHGFSKKDGERLDKALRDSAKAIAPTPIGNDRNALYSTHKDLLITQFATSWNFTKTTHQWTKSSIGKIMQNYLFDYNKKNGTTSRPGPGRKGTKPKEAGAVASGQGLSSSSGPVIKQEQRVVGRPRKPFASSTSYSFQPINKPVHSTADPQAITSSSSPLRPTSTPSQSPVDSALPTVERTLFRAPSISKDIREATDNAQSFVSYSRSNGSQSTSIRLSEIIVAVTPKPDDPWGRKVVSFPLWRCQVPVDGRDAAPEALQGWRDVSFSDFVRQLQAEEVFSTGDVLIWGQFDQIVRSDMTFAGAIEEQLLDAGHNGLAFNEANFAILKGESPLHTNTDSRIAPADTGRLVEELVKRYGPEDLSWGGLRV